MDKTKAVNNASFCFSANMFIHKDGKTNLEQLDIRTQEACDWIKSTSYKTKKRRRITFRGPYPVWITTS